MTDVAELEEIDHDDGAPSRARLVAERERARLAASASGNPLVGAAGAVGERVRYLFTARAAENGLRYRPLAWTLIAVVALVAFLPGRDDADAGDLVAAPTPSPVVNPTTPTSTVTTPPLDDSPVSVPTVTVAPPVFTPSPTSPPVTSSPPPRPPTPVNPSPPTVTQPLKVRGFGWASSLAGTPLGSDGVPSGTMPVGNRLGDLDKASFVRLEGDTKVLLLAEDPDGANEAIGIATVRACPIVTPVWQESSEQAFEQAPTWNAENCVQGVENDDVWSFDLSSFASLTSDNGFALVPGDDAPPDFQVTFSPVRP